MGPFNLKYFSAEKDVWETGAVIAFEPLPINSKAIMEQFDINQLSQCRRVCSAIWKKKLFTLEVR